MPHRAEDWLICPTCLKPINPQERVMWDMFSNITYHIGCEPRPAAKPAAKE